MADTELNFLRLIQAAQAADVSWSREHGVLPLASTRFANARIANLIRAAVWEARIIRRSQTAAPTRKPNRTPVKQAILVELDGKVLDQKEIKDRVGECSTRGLSIVLGQLLHEGEITVTADGRYSRTTDKNSPALGV